MLGTSVTWVSARTRPGFEIDARAQRNEPTYAASAEVRGSARTLIGVRGAWTQVRFDENATFEGNSLQEQLDRTAIIAAITLRHELTPLTSIMFSGGRSEQRFTFAGSRNATSTDYSVIISFDPAAVLKGSASIGYTQYTPESADLPGYGGPIASVGLTYTLLGSTRLTGSITQSVEFSYDSDQPYYVLTGATASIAQQVFLAGRSRRSHRRREPRIPVARGSSVSVPDRTDRVRSCGVGVGFRIARELRLGFNVDTERRTSVVPDRQYEGLKYGTSITYGL